MAEKEGILERAMQAVAESYNSAAGWADEVMNVGSRADDEAERRFPNDARDESRKNAYRHALGTGRLAQLLGADSDNPAISQLGQAAGQGAGYIWELLAARRNLENPRDMKHDLNANAIGVDVAARTRGFNALADSLDPMARSAVKEDPPLVFDPARKHLTYSK